MPKQLLTLREASASEEARKAFSADMVEAIDQCVTELHGLKGVLLRDSYSVIKNIRPHYIEHVINVMTPELLDAFQPIHDKYSTPLPKVADSFPPFIDHLKAYQDETYAAITSVTDKYANERKNHIVGQAYTAFKPALKNWFGDALPYIANVIEKHTIKDV